MTAIAVTTYLLYQGEYVLTLLSIVVFGKLIVFHFVMDYFDKQNLKKFKISQNIELLIFCF